MIFGERRRNDHRASTVDFEYSLFFERYYRRKKKKKRTMFNSINCSPGEEDPRRREYIVTHVHPFMSLEGNIVESLSLSF